MAGTAHSLEDLTLTDPLDLQPPVLASLAALGVSMPMHGHAAAAADPWGRAGSLQDLRSFVLSCYEEGLPPKAPAAHAAHALAAPLAVSSTTPCTRAPPLRARRTPPRR